MYAIIATGGKQYKVAEGEYYSMPHSEVCKGSCGNTP